MIEKPPQPSTGAELASLLTWAWVIGGFVEAQGAGLAAAVQSATGDLRIVGRSAPILTHPRFGGFFTPTEKSKQ
jgi:hypothetical protein